MGYMPADWWAGVRPPKGWDCADAFEDGWTTDDYMKMLKDAVTSDDLDFISDEPPAPEPVDDGWSKADIDAAVCDVLPPFPDLQSSTPPEKEARPMLHSTALRGQPVGADGISAMSRVMDIEDGGEVGIAQHFALVLRKLCGDVVRADGTFWAWGPTAWVEIDPQHLRLAVHSYSGTTVQGKTKIKLASRAIDGVLVETGTILGDSRFFSDPTVGLNARNGVIRIAQGGDITTHEHSPDDRFRFTIDADYRGEAAMPSAGSLLHTLVNGAFKGDPDAEQKIDLIGEILGAAAFGMATRLPQPKAFVFLGESASNGKSTIASLIECLLPHGAVSHVAPSALEDLHRRVHLAGKAANVADELSASAIAGETLKSCITGQAIDGRDLYKSALTFVPRALHLYTTNVLPRFNGGLDRGLQRRLMVVKFNRTIPAEEIIPDIAERIRTDELDLLLAFAVAGAQRLTLRRAYTEPTSSKEALAGWLLLDPLNEWFEDRVERTEQAPVDGWHPTKVLFDDFKSWAIEQGHGEKFLPPVNTFSQRLKAIPGVDTKRTGRVRSISGIVLRSPPSRTSIDIGW